ncbi:MAG: putative glycoside hydrolase, partial [Patescibacteria group bacterium]
QKPDYRGKVIPWLQDFDYPVDYTPAMVAAQIKAARDAGMESYLFWDAGNKYSSLRQVLAP